MPRISKGAVPKGTGNDEPGRSASRPRAIRGASAPDAPRDAVAADLDFKLLFEGAPGLFVALRPDPEFTILGATDTYLRATLTERKDIVGRGLFHVLAGSPAGLSGAGATDLRASLARVVAGKVSDAIAVQSRDFGLAESAGSGAHEERSWRAVNDPVIAASGELLYILLRIEDVSELVQSSRMQEHERERSAALERRVQAMNQELESFSYSISHDLRAPLRAIDGFSRIVEEDYGERLDDEGRRLLGVVRENSRRMSELIDAILEFSRLGRKPLATAEIDMRRAVEQAIEQCQTAKSPLTIEIGPLPAARGDPALIKQLWLNLLSNALKFSAQGERPIVTISGAEDGAEKTYCVKDNGVGFDMRYYERLFGMFQRLHSEEQFPGTGAGLAMVQRIVARHGGRVWAESAPNQGATFCFSLPKAHE